MQRTTMQKEIDRYIYIPTDLRLTSIAFDKNTHRMSIYLRVDTCRAHSSRAFELKCVQEWIRLDYIVDLARDESLFNANWRVQLRP